MDNRLELHQILIDIIGNNNVYFQPPSSIKLTYPCIIYKLSNFKVTYADSIKYANMKAYEITVIDQNPDSIIPSKLLELEYCQFNTFFTSDNLNHFVFSLFYKI